jgi:hypothetical protein
MSTARKLLLCSALVVVALVAPSAADARPHSHDHHHHSRAHLLVSGLEGGAGSTVGPDGALYVTETVAGRVTRVDPRTGATSTYADGLPRRVIDTGGGMDVAFLGYTAYVLVTLVGPDVGGHDTVGIYRIDGRHHATVVADIGAFSIANPPVPPFFIPSGVQYAIQAYRGGFLVTDGHHNRVLWVSPDGRIRQLIAFGNIVPTGLETRDGKVYVSEAGPVPHDPADGRIVAFRPGSSTARQVASGASLLVDVEFAHHGLYALSQGDFSGGPEGSPALPDTGSLVKVGRHGTFDVVVDELNQPTSVDFIHNTAYVVTLNGEIWTIHV